MIESLDKRTSMRAFEVQRVQVNYSLPAGWFFTSFLLSVHLIALLTSLIWSIETIVSGMFTCLINKTLDYFSCIKRSTSLSTSLNFESSKW